MNDDDPFFPTAVEIPTCWSPEQALIIADFLSDIVSAIWRVYGSDIKRYFRHHSAPPGLTAIDCLDDDDIPF